MTAAEAAGLSQLTDLGGIKFVSSDMGDFLAVNTWVAAGGQNGNPSRNATVLFAPEPKLQVRMRSSSSSSNEKNHSSSSNTDTGGCILADVRACLTGRACRLRCLPVSPC